MRKYKLIGISTVLCVTMTMLGGCAQKEETVYRETQVAYGSLVVGKTQSGAVDIGTVDQVFELDYGALERVGISGSSTESENAVGNGGMMGGMMGKNGMGGMDMFTQVFHMADGGSLVSSQSSTELVISQVCVTVGEEVKEGDTLFFLEEEGVADLTQELESNVSKAKADLDALIADQNLSKTTAGYTYETSLAYGEYAEKERQDTISALQDSVKEKTEALEDAKASLEKYTKQLAQALIDYEKAEEALQNAEWSRDNTEKEESLYYYTVAAEQAISAKQLADNLLQEKEQLENRVKQAEENVSGCEKELASAKRSLEEGLLSAEKTYELRKLAYETAQETYDVTLAYLEDDLKTQQEIYDETETKWEEFTSHINGNAILSKYNGVVTDVGLTEGDRLETGTVVVTLYDTDTVSMTVSIPEEDMTDIAVGSAANINFTAYPEKQFSACVSEISDAVTDSDGTVTYEVTATIEGDTSGLFQGMTGDITFITKQMEDVMYVSNRTIIRDGRKSYVKVKAENGSIRKAEVQTGFSDGINVEVISGLEIGDTVLIESKVGES